MDTALANLQAKKKIKDQEDDQQYSYKEREYDQPSYHSVYRKNYGTLFYFDPNTIDAAGWKKLGLRDKTIGTILNYRSKGGKFKKPEDIRKVWGLFPDEAERLIPYIKIENSEENIFVKDEPAEFYERKKYESIRTYKAININHADTSEWIALPGIGSKLSQRIISFRDKLGGFYSVQQVGETFGLADSVFQKIKPFLQVSGEVKKININKASIEALKTHPYIRYAIGNAIIQYRKQHGDYKSIGDMKKIMIVDDTLFNKLSPYLTIE